MLRNGKFDGGTDGTQQRYIWQDDKPVAYPETYDNIWVPSYWTLSYVEGVPGPGAPENVTGRPEADVIYRPTAPDPKRFLLDIPYTFKAFTFWRNHNLFLHQTVSVPAFNKICASVWQHSWYSRCSTEPHTDPLDDDCSNPLLWASLSVRIGIDPTGGNSPFSDNIKWGNSYEIYGEFKGAIYSPEIELDHATYVTVFIESITSHPLKHNDVYLSDVQLHMEPIEPPPGGDCKESSRIPYARTVNVYDPLLGRQAYLEVCESVWDEHGPQTISPSTDDAFVGCGLGSKTGRWWHVLAKEWPDYVDFGATCYPNTQITMLREGDASPSPSPPPSPLGGYYGIHRQTNIGGEPEQPYAFYTKVGSEWAKLVYGIEDAQRTKEAGAENVDYRIPIAHQGQYIQAMDIDGYLNEYDPVALEKHIDWVDAIEGTNEEDPNNPQVLEFEMRLSDEVRNRWGDDLRLVSGNWAVGNGNGEALIEWGRVLMNNKHIGGYHPYFPVDLTNAEAWMESEAKWYHLRHLLLIDPVLRANGVYIPWLGTEGGGVRAYSGVRTILKSQYGQGGEGPSVFFDPKWLIRKKMTPMLGPISSMPTGVLELALASPGHLDPGGGWRHPEALNADRPRYINLLLSLRKMRGDWNLDNGDRDRGNMLFTVGADFVGWDHFKLWDYDLEQLSNALAAL